MTEMTINVPMAQQRDIQTVTTEIRTLHRQAQGMILNYAIEIGRRLKEAKSLLGHGEWGEWLETEVDFSRSTANNFMKIFEEYGAKQVSLFGDANSQTLGNLPYTHALKLLAVPAEEREEFAAENRVEELSSRELERLIRERDEAMRRAEGAETREREQAETIETLKKLAQQSEAQEQTAAQEQEAIRTLEEKVSRAEEKLKKEREKAKEKLQMLQEELQAAKENPEVSEELRAQLRAEGQEALQKDLQKAVQEKADAEQALADARKALQMADSDTAVFKELFRRVQEDWQKMQETIRRVEEKDAERAQKLKSAVSALVNGWT